MSMVAFTGEVVSEVRIKKPYQASEKEVVCFEKESRTQQSFLKECDVNNIVKRYKATGLMRQVPGEPLYADFTTLPKEYQDALNTVVQAQDAFARLSSDVRSRFDNDPAAFVEFATNPDNIEQMREWKLAPPAAKPAEVEPAAPAKAGTGETQGSA